MQKTLLIVIVLVVIALIAVGAFYLLQDKVEEGSSTQGQGQGQEPESQIPDLGNLAPEIELGAAGENPLQDVPEINPLEDVPNPFEGGYENPFE